MSLFSLGEIGTADSRPRQWRLSRVEVVNWGTFDGSHRVDVAWKGHLFTGSSGSGKSTLLDAITAVLTPKGSVTFNAAAQDSRGRAGDRSWVSYVRGAWGRQSDDLQDRTVTTFLRPKATWSGILLRFEDGASEPVNLVRLFHIKGTSTSPADLKEMSIITRGDESLMDFAPYAQTGLDKRSLDRQLNPVISTSTGKHKGFVSRMCSLLGISSPTALLLLHRTQAAKNLGSLDDLLRRFMLEVPDTFGKADRAVEQFQELRKAYDHVVDLRRQRDVLIEVTAAADEVLTAEKDVEHLSALAEGAQAFADNLKLRLARKSLLDARAALARSVAAHKAAAHQSEGAHALERSAYERLVGVGGGEVRVQTSRIEEARTHLTQVRARREARALELGQVGLEMPVSEDEFEELAATARAALNGPKPERLSPVIFERLSNARRRVRTLEVSLATLREHRSNMDRGLLKIRTELCRELSIPSDLLPFAGELISVREEFSAWRGAIERVLRPLATTLLVRDEDLPRVRRAVDSRHLGVRLTIDVVPTFSPAPLPVDDPRSLVSKVTVSKGVFHDELMYRLSERFDYACVGAPGDLDSVKRGVTIEGLIKQSGRRYVKDDRHGVNDQMRWVLGGDLAPKHEALVADLSRAQAELEVAEEEADREVAGRDLEVRRRQMYSTVINTPWAEVDVAAQEKHVESLQKALEALTQPGSDIALAEEQWRLSKADLDVAKKHLDDARSAEVRAEADCQHFEKTVAALQNAPAVPTGLEQELHALFHEGRRHLRVDQVDRVRDQVTRKIGRRRDRSQQRVLAATSRFTHLAARFANQWGSVVAGASLSVEFADQAGYRGVLEEIRAQGLPEHENNFRRLLDERARDDIVFLNDEIANAPKRIKQRIEEVNESLAQTAFDQGRFLHIRVKVLRPAELVDFQRQLGAIVRGNFAEQDLEEAEERFAVLAEVMNRLGSAERVDQQWRSRVLDTRTHVSFIAEELDEDGHVQNVHDSATGLSGGQRQKLIAFSLAAALQYQLADTDANLPSYGTVVIDEAFDQSDPVYTKYALDAFKEFGFHMVMASPNKSLQTFEPYLGAVTVVSNPSRDASSMSNATFA